MATKQTIQQSYKIQLANHKIRTILAFLFFIFCFILLGYRLFQLQIVQGNNMFQLGQKNQYSSIILTPQRGKIYDRNYTLLAVNNAIFNVDLLLNDKQEAKKGINILKPLLSLSEEETNKIVEKIKKNRKKIRIKSNITKKELQQIYLKAYKESSINVTHEFIREYPCKESCAQVVGYASLNNSLKKEKLNTSENIMANYIGITGIEKQYNKELSGRYGTKNFERNAQGQTISELTSIHPTHGNDLILTIDTRLQKIIHKNMKGTKGSVVIINPKNGEVLGLYSAPSYDPNIFLSPNKNTLLKNILTNKDKPLFNRAIAGMFPPASTIKPFLALYSLNKKLIDTSYKIYDPGYLRYKETSYIYRNWKKEGHGLVDTKKAIEVSNDTYFYNLALKIGIENIYKALKTYHFGEITGIDIPGEKKGVVPNKKNKENKGLKWHIGDTIISGIGQGDSLSTPLQLTYSMATLGNNGQGYTPHILKKQHKSSGNEEIIKPLKTPKIESNKENWDYIKKAMQAVTKTGSGRNFGELKWTIAGKTGTAQVIKNSGKDQKNDKRLADHTWFSGFTPVNNPKIAITVIIENSNGATRKAHDILTQYIQLISKDE